MEAGRRVEVSFPTIIHFSRNSLIWLEIRTDPDSDFVPNIFAVWRPRRSCCVGRHPGDAHHVLAAVEARRAAAGAESGLGERATWLPVFAGSQLENGEIAVRSLSRLSCWGADGRLSFNPRMANPRCCKTFWTKGK